MSHDTTRRAPATLRDAFRGAYRHHWRGDGRFAEFLLAFRAGVCSRRNAPSSARSLVTFFDSENAAFLMRHSVVAGLPRAQRRRLRWTRRR